MRRRDYDDAPAGASVVMLWVEQYLLRLGSIHEGQMHRSPAAEMIAPVWTTLEQ